MIGKSQKSEGLLRSGKFLFKLGFLTNNFKCSAWVFLVVERVWSEVSLFIDGDACEIYINNARCDPDGINSILIMSGTHNATVEEMRNIINFFHGRVMRGNEKGLTIFRQEHLAGA